MKEAITVLLMLLTGMTVSAQTTQWETLGVNGNREQLWQSFLSPPDSIKVGCYYYWVNEHIDPKGVKADLKWMKDNGITLAFLATDIRNRTRWENPWEGQTFGKNKFQNAWVEESAHSIENGRRIGHRDGHL